ncbi:hypothetical protein VM95_31490, partial [Streptomyces rubellomurinus]
SGCIAIDWKQELQETAAAQVLFLVDACRQGIRDAMGPPPGWSPSKMRAVAGRKVARLYACAPGELARFVPAEESTAQGGDGSFSLFSRAVREVLVSHEGPLDLSELRAGVQERVSALHREHRKPGRPQEVRVLTEAVHAEFVVVGALKVPAVPVVAAVESEPVPVSPVVKDPAKLMADALHQVVTTGRTEFLEEFAVIGPAADLLKLSAVVAPAAVDVMWTAAAGRPVEQLVELTVALYGAKEIERAVWLVGMAVAARPLEDLPGLLDALEAAGLRAQADGLVPMVAAAGDPPTMEHLLALLADAGRDRNRAAVLSGIADGSMPRLVEWLAIGGNRAGFDEDAAFVLNAAVARRDDRHLLLTELRRIGQDGHLRTVQEEARRLEPPVLHALLERLHAAGADEDGEAVTRCAVDMARPVTAVRLAALLRERGPAELFPLVLTALCRADVDQAAGFLLVALEDGDDDLVDEALSALAERFPSEGFDLLAAELDVHPDLVAGLRRKALDLRPMADVLAMLERAGDEERSAMLERLASSDRPPGELAELVEMPGRHRLRRRTGAQVAACLLARDDSALTGVLAELLDRDWTAGARLLLGQIVVGGNPREQAGVAEWLQDTGRGEQARSLLDRICEERGTAHQSMVAEKLLAGGQPELGMHVAAVGVRTWPTRDLVRQARRLAEAGARTESAATVGGAAFLLTHAVQVRSAESAAELLLALDAEPEEDGPAPVDQLLVEYLTAGPRAEAVPRIVLLRDARPGSRVALGVSAWVRAHAPLLFREAWQAGPAEAVECLLAAYGDGGSVGPLELGILLPGLRSSGSGSEADFVRDAAVLAALPWSSNSSSSLDRQGIVRALGTDRPIAEIVASPGRNRAQLATAVLFRRPEDVSELLAGAPSPELRQILAVVRPVPELVEVLRALMKSGQRDDAARIVDIMLAAESPARIGELLEATPFVHGREYVAGPAWVVADRSMRKGTTAELVRALLDAGYGRAVERLLDELTVAATGAKGAAALVKRLAATGVGREVYGRLITGFCERRPHEAVERFREHLGPFRPEVAPREKDRERDDATAPPPSKGWFRRKG